MAAVDYFLKLDGIDGESQDSKHKNEIEVLSYKFGSAQQGGSAYGSGAGSGKVQMEDFHFTMRVNKASPKLFLYHAGGQPITTAVLTCRKAGKDQQEFLKWTFSNVLVSSFHTGGSDGNSLVPVDEITLNFTSVVMEYKEQKADGTLGGAIKTGWDLKQNKAAAA
ncbi:MAG TPA: type VI secretion system tube protein Hcp [Bryobacteraceae bacterium]|jgi:type VI secretion system secreted protein Hcp|nr:type VI secretion system tube protein Hcp [Bryobacteraceae bacterium]